METRRALEQAAEAEQRNLSNMTLHIVTGWLEKNGYLSAPAGQRRKQR
jgi:hypothetical protein